MNKRSQVVYRVLIACLVGLLMSGICLHIGLPTTASLLQERQTITRQRFVSVEAELENYYTLYHVYPKALSQLTNYSDNFANDGWSKPIIYKTQSHSFLLTSYGADHKLGGVGLNYDLTSRNPTPSEAQPSIQEILASPLSAGLKSGAIYSGLLTAFLAFSSLNNTNFTRRSKGTFALKMILTLSAALLVSLFITFADIPTGH